ncbi:hypothetical protein ACFL2X_06380 [Candidatus Latescibacterota bacterium]
MRDINLKELEGRAWKATFEDGLWDIMLGIIFFVPAVNGLFAGSDYTLIPLYIAGIVLFVLGKKHITIPRIGLVRFGDERKKRSFIIAMMLSLSVIVMILLIIVRKNGFLFQPGNFPAGSFIVGMNILLVFSAMAYFLNFTRLYLYAVLLGAVEPLTAVMEQGDMISGPYLFLFVISGGMILLGIFLLVRFIRNHPLQKEEV